MFLRAGLLSFVLLLASRLLGLLRESLQAAALGATGLADVAILTLTLPDLLTGILASGAMAYVLLPLWAAQPAQDRGDIHARLARVLLAVGLLVGVLIALAAPLVVQALAPGLSEGMRETANVALMWSAVAMPLALLAALWTTYLQHCRDFTGMYGANLTVNAAIIGALLLIALGCGNSLVGPITLLGAGLVLGMCLRLGWLRWRLERSTAAQTAKAPRLAAAAITWPRAPVWLWAIAAAALPLLLPVLGRSLTSTSGDGALATFNFAWKLIELPLVLAVQLVAALAFPGLASAFAGTDAASGEARSAQQRDALRHAFVLAWVLACAAAAALAGMAPALAALLFGWGRMAPEAIAEVGLWGRAGAWSLLPQSLLAVLSILMASTGRLRDAVIVYLGALTLLAILGWLFTGPANRGGALDGAHVMWSINATLAIAAAALLWRARALVTGALHVRDLAPAAASAMVLALAAASLPPPASLPGLGLAVLLAALVLLAAWMCSPGLREALRR